MIVGDATVNSDGTADFTGGTIDFTNSAGKLILSSAVTSLGTLDDAMGTVEYDGAGNQTILADTYYNLELDGDGSGNKKAGSSVNVNGTFTVGANCEGIEQGHTTTITGLLILILNSK